MKRILFIAPLETKNRFKGGITSYAKTIIDNANLFQNSNIFFCPFNNCFINRKSGTNGKISISNFINFFKTKLALSKKIKNEHFDAIYLNTSYGISLLKDLFTIKKKYKNKLKVIIHIHFAGIDNVFTKNILINRLITKNLKLRTTHIISLSSDLKAKLIKKGLCESRISVLYNCFDSKLPNISSLDLKEKYKAPIDFITFLFVGSFDKRKGFFDLIDVFNNQKTLNKKLCLCGKPNDKEAEKCIVNIRDNQRFIYLGYVDGIKKIEAFKQANVLVLPSYGEGLPITILEALNFGLPIISTEVGAIPEIITNKEGILIKPGDKCALEEALNFYTKNNLLTISINNLKKSKNFTFPVFAEKLIRIMNTALEKESSKN